MQEFAVGPEDCSPSHYEYVLLVRDKNITAFLQSQGEHFSQWISGIPESKGDYAYGEGKWTVKQAIQHIIDTERVFTYRLLALSRGEQQPIPGFEQDDYAQMATAAHRTLGDQRKDFDAVRNATLSLMASLTPADLKRTGTVSGHPATARALPYIMAGHIEHHMKVFRERYHL